MSLTMLQSLATFTARVGSLLPRVRRGARRRVVREWYDDWVRTHPSVGLTPARALSLLHAADDGAPEAQFELYGEMLRKWPRLAAVEATRRLALTGLEWEILPCAAERGEVRARLVGGANARWDGSGFVQAGSVGHIGDRSGAGGDAAELPASEEGSRGRLRSMGESPAGRRCHKDHEDYKNSRGRLRSMGESPAGRRCHKDHEDYKNSRGRLRSVDESPAGRRCHIEQKSRKDSWGELRFARESGSDVRPRSILGRDASLAEAAAAYCRETLECLEGFDAALRHLASAIGYGIAVCELVWERGRLVDIVPVPHSRLVSDPHEPWRLRVRTEEDPALGVPLDASPNKWIVHRPNAQPGRQFDGGLLRASALLYLAQNLSLKDWLIYSQIAGMPLRVARYEPGTPEADRAALLKMLEKLGTDAVAVISRQAELSLLEPRGGEKPYQAIQDYCNTEVTILWLGQHLTTDVRTSGSRAAAEIHDRVREDLLVGDIAEEAATIRRDLLTPLTRARFGEAAPVPMLRRSLMQSVDTRVLAETLSRAVRELGLRVPKRWAHRALGIPEPRADEAVLAEGGQA